MRRCIGVVALAGMTCTASAQSGLNVSLSFGASTTGLFSVNTGTIVASWDGPALSYLSSVNIDLILNRPGLRVLSVAPIAWNNPALGFSGSPTSIDGGNIIGLQAAQFSLIPPYTSSNPLLITTFEYAIDSPGVQFTYSARVSDGAPFPFSVTGPGFSDPVVSFGLDAFSSGTVAVVPAPGAAALLGVAGMMMRRQRV